MATLAAVASIDAVSFAPCAGVAASAAAADPSISRLVYPVSSATAARAWPPRHRIVPPLVRLSGPRRALPARPRLVAASSIAPVTKMTSTVSTAASSAASWAAAVWAPVPHAEATAASPSLSAIAISAAKMLLELTRMVAEKVGADLSEPWIAAVSGAGRCLELYREIMLVRCLLTWFPNVPWERQPFSAMRDLCDPFLRLFQRIVPPVFGSRLDISSLLAFTAIGVLARLMSPSTASAL